MIDYVILCAGRGTRLKSTLPKPFVPIYGKSSVEYLIDLLPEEPYLVISPENLNYKKNIPGKIVLQKEPLGTGHALECFLQEPSSNEYIFILLGDMPLLSSESFQKMFIQRPKNYLLAISHLQNPSGYGRVFRTEKGFYTKADQELSEEEKKNQFISTGFCLLNRSYVEKSLPHVPYKETEKPLPGIFQGELEGDLIELPEEESLGINTPEDFSKVSEILRKKILQKHLNNGVLLKNPTQTYIDSTVIIYPGVIIANNVILKNKTLLNSGVQVDENLILDNLIIPKNTHVTKNYLLNLSS